MSIAFFDLDKTLIADNSARLWLRAEWESGHITMPKMVQASYWLLKYHLGFTHLDEVIKKSLMFIAGENQEETLVAIKEFYRTTIKNLYRPGALEAIKYHKERGHKIALLTSCFDGLSVLVQEEQGFDFCLCTRLEVNEKGQYTGKTLGMPCFGQNKVIYAKDLCASLELSLKECTFYTDSASDIPLLNLVGRAVAINPDPHLRVRARLKKWEVIDWGKP